VGSFFFSVTIGIHGLERSGKTTFATWLALQSWALGKTIYANFALYFGERVMDDGSVINTLEPFGLDPDAHEPPHKLDMGVLLSRDLKKCDIFIDEAHGWFDCRSSPSLGNRVMSWFLLQSEKRDINIYYIAHEPSMLDSRIQRHLRVQFLCEWVGDIRHPKPSDYIRVFMVTRHLAQTPPFAVLKVPNPRLLWPMFDTRELVPLDPTIEADLADMFEVEEVDGELRTVSVRSRRGRRK